MQYTDDCTIAYKARDSGVINQGLHELTLIDWLKTRRLDVSILKTKLIIFETETREMILSIQIGNEITEEVSGLKFSGMGMFVLLKC